MTAYPLAFFAGCGCRLPRFPTPLFLIPCNFTPILAYIRRIHYLRENKYKSIQVKIIFSDNTLWGLLNFRGGVIRSFAQQGHDLLLVAPQDKMCDLSSLPASVRYQPIQMDRTGMNPWRDYQYYRTLYRLYKKEAPDYIFHYTIKPNIYGSIAAHRLGIRSSCMIAGLGHVYSRGGLGNRIARRMYRYAMRYPERVMVLNQSNYETLLSHHVVSASQLLWLRGGEGVDTTRFQPLPMPEHKRPVFLMICRLLYEKGYKEYVAAAEALRGQAEFRIMGPIDTHPSAVPQRVVEEDVARGVIRYIPYSPDVASQIGDADCIVLPSYHEGMSRVLMEALAFGRPIITTNISGCRETVAEGENGYLVPIQDAAALTQACRRFIDCSAQERTEMAHHSRTKAETTFSESQVIAHYHQLLSGHMQ